MAVKMERENGLDYAVITVCPSFVYLSVSYTVFGSLEGHLAVKIGLKQYAQFS